MALARQFPTNHGPPSVSNNSHHLIGGPHGVGISDKDFLTASFLLTQKNVFLSRDKFYQLCCSLTDGLEKIESSY